MDSDRLLGEADEERLLSQRTRHSHPEVSRLAHETSILLYVAAIAHAAVESNRKQKGV